MNKAPLNETFEECRPWDTGFLKDNTNILNNLKQNLLSYEKGYKKYSVKTRSQLPQIRTQHTDSKPRCEASIKENNIQKPRLLTIDHMKKKAKSSKSKHVVNKSTELSTAKSQFRFVKTRQIHKRGLTSMESIDKEEKQIIVTERNKPVNSSKKNFKSKVFLMNFDEQNNYRRLTKREIHQFVFGERQKIKYKQFKQMR